MFSHTAYEALYLHLGLALHEKFIEVITSQKIFLAALLIIFGIVFFGTTVRFFSRYLPGVLVRPQAVPLSAYFKIVLSLFIGMSILRVSSHTSVKRFDGRSWHDNAYIQQKIQRVEPDYKVSFVFDLLSRTPEELTKLLSRIIDQTFQSTHSHLEAPNFFFKAIAYAGSATIEDPELRSNIDFYVNECFDRVLSFIPKDEDGSVADRFFGDSYSMDEALSELPVPIANGKTTTCLEIKEEVRTQLMNYSQRKGNDLPNYFVGPFGGPTNLTAMDNLRTSEFLVNHFYENREGFLGIQKGSQPPSGAARIFQYLNRFFSWDTVVSIFSGGSSEEHGAALAARRAQKFSENLKRAPHVAGAIKMVLIMIFPWLVFLMAAGNWKVLIYWFFAYFSVLLWTPFWTLFYHIIVNIALSAEHMEALGRLSDGISLYSAELITHRMNYMFAVFSWIQLLIGVFLSGGILLSIRPMISDSEGDQRPEFIQGGEKALAAGTKAGRMIGG